MGIEEPASPVPRSRSGHRALVGAVWGVAALYACLTPQLVGSPDPDPPCAVKELGGGLAAVSLLLALTLPAGPVPACSPSGAVARSTCDYYIMFCLQVLSTGVVTWPVQCSVRWRPPCSTWSWHWSRLSLAPPTNLSQLRNETNFSFYLHMQSILELPCRMKWNGKAGMGALC